MSAKPTRAEFEIGRDRYGRRSVLIAERVGGQLYWNIESQPTSQRDEGEIIRSLTTSQLVEIGRIAEQEN